MKNIVITFDGPAGTGKSTVARKIAQILEFLFLDTGALYRASALAADRENISMDNDARCADIVLKTDINLVGDKVFIDGQDVTSLIRSARISDFSSKIATLPSVRMALLGVQQSFAQRASVVAEGRDTGSVVFPGADIKFYLDASPQERAQRRFRELIEHGIEATYDKVLSDIVNRDNRDASRAHAPLVIPNHAIVVDTTHMKLEEVIQKILRIIQEKLADK